MAEVVGAGLVALDHVFLAHGKRISPSKTEYLGSSGGGSVGNTLCLLALLGHKTSMIGVVGNDPIATAVRTDFGMYGVDTQYLRARGGSKNPVPTRQYSHLIYSDGRHTFREYCLRCDHRFKRSAALLKSEIRSGMRRLSQEASVLHTDRANRATVELANQAQKGKHKVSFDLTFLPFGKSAGSVDELLGLTSFVKTNERLFKRHIGASGNEGIWSWQRRYPKTETLIVTRGGRGIFGFSTIEDERVIFRRRAIPCDAVRDSGGAGDVLTALSIHILLLGKSTDENDLVDRLDMAQSLASLSCSLYGARSLQRAYRLQETSPEAILQSANDIRKIGRAGNSFPVSVGIPRNFSFPFRFAPEASCSVCGSIGTRRRKRNSSRRPAYHVKLSEAPGVMSYGWEVAQPLREHYRFLRINPSIFIGSGGSLSAGVFGEQLALGGLGKIAKAMPPYEFLRMPALDSTVSVWLLSYGGSNPDILSAASHAAGLKARNVVVLTGSPKSELAQKSADRRWATIELPGQERGFVSTVGMLAMVSALSVLLAQDDDLEKLEAYLDYANLLDTFRSSDRKTRALAATFPADPSSIHLIGLSSGWGWPALVDFESKLVEGGLCTIEVSEMKNFTHGRYINAFHHRENRRVLVFETPQNRELATFINRKINRYIRVTTLSTRHQGLIGAIDLMIQQLFLASHISRRAGKDLSNPKYPAEARGLYGWVPKRKGRLSNEGFERGPPRFERLEIPEK